jgi:hypothetical protein
MHRRNRAKEGNQNLECGWCAHCTGMNEYRNLKFAQGSLGRGVGRSEENWKRWTNLGYKTSMIYSIHCKNHCKCYNKKCNKKCFRWGWWCSTEVEDLLIMCKALDLNINAAKNFNMAHFMIFLFCHKKNWGKLVCTLLLFVCVHKCIWKLLQFFSYQRTPIMSVSLQIWHYLRSYWISYS